MSPREIALEFVERFCDARIDELAPLLAEDLRLRGPLYTCDSRADYLTCLRNDPPEMCPYHVLSITDDREHVAVFYEYRKSAGTIVMAQLFTIERERIREMLLVFDTRQFDRT